MGRRTTTICSIVSNGTPDECEFHLDCQPNGVPDICEVFDDCDGNSVPDECEPDCDSDGLPDDCEIDCNSDGVPDDCQTLEDCNSDGTPGEVLGASGLESGWFQMRGRVANSSAGHVDDPAIYGVLMERAGRIRVADAPFEIGGRAGHLSVEAVVGDNEEWGGVNAHVPDARIQRRRPGSLLLYPEFDNRHGVASVMTLTNVSEEDVHVHFVYIGRWQQL